MKYQPMLATKTDRLLTGSGWIHERKHDGDRMLMETGPDARLLSKTGHDWTRDYVGLTHVARLLPAAVLDGEFVGGKNGTFWAFDILELDGHDLRDMPLLQRKAVLRLLAQGTDSHRMRLVEHTVDAPYLWDRGLSEAWEGIVSKRADSTYRDGRSQNWKKLKPHYL